MTRCLPLLLLLACAPTETGNPLTMALSSHSTDPASVDLRGGTGIVVQNAWVGIGDLRFVAADVCDAPGETEVQLAGPTIADVARLDPFLATFDVRDGAYCRVRVPLERARDLTPDLPGELEDHSLLIEGTTAEGRAFLLRSRIEPELDVRSRTEPFDLGEALPRIVLSFDVARWFAGVDLSSATLEADGSVRIDDDTNRDLLDHFEANLEATLELYDDVDGDGRRGMDDRRLAESG